jgi:CspA family cold shock protein
MQTGTIKWFDAAKGFGFVIPNEGGPDIYVHLKVLQKVGLETLEPATDVNFSVVSRGGKQFVEEIAVVAAPSTFERSYTPQLSGKTASLDAEELFEREWGLRRA